MNNLKTKVDDLDVDKLKTVFVDLKRLSGVVSKEVVKKTVHNKVNTEVNNLENKIPDLTTLIPINQYITDKQSLDEKNRRCGKKMPDVSGLATTTVFNTKIG